MYRVFLRNPDQQVVPSSVTITKDASAAVQAFAALIERTDFDGKPFSAVLNCNRTQLAHHRFHHRPGQEHYWRGRLDEIKWPKTGHPRVLEGGKRISVYLDVPSHQHAVALGGGNASEGIRLALAAIGRKS